MCSDWICKMCIRDRLYPAPAADDEYLLFLKRQMAGWTSALDADGCWPGVSSEVALERIGDLAPVEDHVDGPCMILDLSLIHI